MSGGSARKRGREVYLVLQAASPAEAAAVDAARDQQASSDAADATTAIQATYNISCHEPNRQQLLVAVCLGAVQQIEAHMTPGAAAVMTSTHGFGKTSVLHLGVWARSSLTGLLALLKAGCPPDL